MCLLDAQRHSQCHRRAEGYQQQHGAMAEGRGDQLEGWEVVFAHYSSTLTSHHRSLLPHNMYTGYYPLWFKNCRARGKERPNHILPQGGLPAKSEVHRIFSIR